MGRGRRHAKSTPSPGGSAPASDPVAAGKSPSTTAAPTPPAAESAAESAAERTEPERVRLEQEAQSLEERLTEVRDRLLTNTAAEVNGLFQILGSKRRLVAVNFLAGLARGLGFFLGVTLVGALLIGGGAFLLDWTARTIGLDDVTTIGMVEPIFHKFREVERLWSELESEANDPTPVKAGYVATPFGLVWTGNGEPELPPAAEGTPSGGGSKGAGNRAGNAAGEPSSQGDGDR